MAIHQMLLSGYVELLLNDLQDLHRAGLARQLFPGSRRLPQGLGAHGLLVNEQAAEPEIGLAAVQIGIHLHRQILESFLIAAVDRLFKRAG